MMNIAARQELMQILTELSTQQPYIRLGQLIANLTERADVPYQNPIPEIEDDELLEAARKYLSSVRQLPREYLADQVRLHSEAVVGERHETR